MSLVERPLNLTGDEPHDMTTTNGAIETFKDIETKALVVDEAKANFKLQSIILDEFRADEVLIDMKYSGICR